MGGGAHVHVVRGGGRRDEPRRGCGWGEVGHTRDTRRRPHAAARWLRHAPWLERQLQPNERHYLRHTRANAMRHCQGPHQAWGKTVTKLVTPEGKEQRLFKLVAGITGFKNSLKGLGYFLGAAILAQSYDGALVAMMALVALAWPWAVLKLDGDLGKSNKKVTLASVFVKNPKINWLSLARAFLFGSRDLWFEVPLPFFLRDGAVGLGWSRELVGLVLALWIIFYGQVQSWAPQTVLGPLRQSPPNKWVAWLWCISLVGCPLFLGSFMQSSPIFETREPRASMAAILMLGIYVFALIFAVNSSVHSYLIVRYSDNDKVAMNVGFYYMSNAIGRLVGTVVSGALYTYAGSDTREGFAACFWCSAAFIVVCAIVTLGIDDDVGGLSCGTLTICGAPESPVQVDV
ncbi:MFS family transporter: multidrug efflux [Pycnococcus provasolii]